MAVHLSNLDLNASQPLAQSSSCLPEDKIITLFKESQNQLTSENSTVPQLNAQYKFVHHIFSYSEFAIISSQAKNRPADFKLKGEQYRELLFALPIQAEFSFSVDHKLENSETAFEKYNLINQLAKRIYNTLLNRFAQELKLEGTHTFACQIVRYTPKINEDMGQGWHYDTGAFATIAMVLQNDFDYIKDNCHGLDIAFNGVPGPFSPDKPSLDEEASPKDGHYTSLSYPQNGAIIFKADQGRVIHRLSELAAKNFSADNPLTRTIVQLVIKDKNWE